MRMTSQVSPVTLTASAVCYEISEIATGWARRIRDFKSLAEELPVHENGVTKCHRGGRDREWRVYEPGNVFGRGYWRKRSLGIRAYGTRVNGLEKTNTHKIGPYTYMRERQADEGNDRTWGQQSPTCVHWRVMDDDAITFPVAQARLN